MRWPSVVEFTYGPSRSDRSTIRIERVDPNDHISRVIRENETFYELNLLEHLQTIFSREVCPVMIDVGANIGNHAVLFARYIASHVIVIEPTPAVLPAESVLEQASSGLDLRIIDHGLDARTVAVCDGCRGRDSSR